MRFLINLLTLISVIFKQTETSSNMYRLYIVYQLRATKLYYSINIDIIHIFVFVDQLEDDCLPK